MKRTFVRYKANPDDTQENERLIANVFAELRAKSPEGLRYLVLKLEDGSFLHFSSVENGGQPVTELEAFRTFQSGVKARCVELPVVSEARIVGDYRTLHE